MRPGLRCGICLVDRVEEENARLSGSPSCFHEPVKDHLSRELSDRFAGSGIHQAVGPTLPDSTHETVSESNREIEVRHFMRLLLQGNEIQNVGVVDPQDAHIGTPSRACLMTSVARLNKRIKEIGPDASPFVVATRSPRGRI